MDTDISAETMLWVINKIADVLVDLADDPDTMEPIDVEELTQQMKNVASIIVEALGMQIVESDGKVATVTIGET
jgi:hypothetical protein